jgi:hypothetical protein
MPQKTKIILIVVSVLAVIGLVFGYFYFTSKSNTTGTSNLSFNPFGTGTTTNNQTGEITSPTGEQTTTPAGQTTSGVPNANSLFHKLTDFSIAGATYFEDTKPIVVTPGTEVTPKPVEVKTIIKADTIAGRKDIQTFLNKTLSLTPPLVIDGSFGKAVTAAIKSFQQLNNLTVTGKIDTATAPYFTKTTTGIIKPVEQKFEIIPSLRYVEKATGHVYQMTLDTKKVDKISNSTIPSIYEAFLNREASTIIYRYLSTDESTINSYVATLGGTTGEFLPSDIIDLSISPDKNSFFYLVKNSDGVIGVTKSFNESKSNQVFSSPFTEWLSQWISNQKIYLTTKPSWSTDGSLFSLNTINGSLTKVFGGVSGLTTLSNNDGSLILYSVSTNTGPRLEVFNINNHTTEDLGVYGLPEKCIWALDNISIYCALPKTITGIQYPDSWYQGLISFEDYFAKIDTNINKVSTIADSTSANEIPVDATKLFFNNNGSQLFFTNKKDLTLWSLDLF